MLEAVFSGVADNVPLELAEKEKDGTLVPVASCDDDINEDTDARLEAAALNVAEPLGDAVCDCEDALDTDALIDELEVEAEEKLTT